MRQKIRYLRRNYDFIFNILKSFFIMVIICAALLVGGLPVALYLYVDSWWILSAFIIWPIGFNGIAWVVDYFDV